MAGLHTAMDFGSPNNVADKATFYMPRNVTLPDVNRDQEKVPFNPNVDRTFSSLVKKVVKCAVEYVPTRAGDEKTDFGILNPDKVKLTILGPDFVSISGFEYVVIGGNKYLYWKEEPLIALGSIDVHTVWCRAEDVH